jgi:hypothetical protein
MQHVHICSLSEVVLMCSVSRTAAAAAADDDDDCSAYGSSV